MKFNTKRKATKAAENYKRDRHVYVACLSPFSITITKFLRLDCLYRKETNDQVYEKLFSIFGCQKKTNGNSTEIPLYSIKNGHHQE